MRPTTQFVQEVWLIRHAESESNAGLATSTPADIQLTERGYQQAALVAQAVSNVPSLVVTSPYRRTAQTAGPTLKKFYEPRHQIWPVEEFTYLSPPNHVNTSPSDRLPMVAAYWNRADPSFVDGEGAESFSALIDRVRSLQERLLTTPVGDFVIIFSHAMFINALRWQQMDPTAAVTASYMRGFQAFHQCCPVQNGAILKRKLDSHSQWWTLTSLEVSHL